MRMMLHLLPALFIAFAATSFAQAGEASDAERFVQENAQTVIDILQDYREGERSLSEVKNEFRSRINELADVERISNFVLGRWRRTAGEQELTEFRETFRTFAIGVYETELTNYAGQSLNVTGSITRAEGDYIVRSQITGGPDGETYQVNWRVLENDAGALRVVDVQVQGVWLAQTQRDQITSIIGNAGGDVSAATRALRQRIASNGGGGNASASN